MLGVDVDGMIGQQTTKALLNYVYKKDKERFILFEKHDNIKSYEWKDLFKKFQEYEEEYGFPNIGRIDFSINARNTYSH